MSLQYHTQLLEDRHQDKPSSPTPSRVSTNVSDDSDAVGLISEKTAIIQTMNLLDGCISSGGTYAVKRDNPSVAGISPTSKSSIKTGSPGTYMELAE